MRNLILGLAALAAAGAAQARDLVATPASVAAPPVMTPAAATGPSITMGEDSGEYTITWRGMADRIVIRWTVFGSKGEIVVCANYAISGHSNRRLSREALRDVAVRMDRKILVQDMTQFNEVSSAKRLVGSTATCIRSGVPVPRDPRAHDFSIGSAKTIYQD